MDGWRPPLKHSGPDEILAPMLGISFTSDAVISVVMRPATVAETDRPPPDEAELLLWERRLASAWLLWAATMIGRGTTFDELEQSLRRCATQGLDAALGDLLGSAVITEVELISPKRSILAAVSLDETSHIVFQIERFRGLFGVRKLAGYYLPLSVAVFLRRMDGHWQSTEGRAYLETTCVVVADLMRDQPDEFPKLELSPWYVMNATPTHERVMAALSSGPV